MKTIQIAHNPVIVYNKINLVCIGKHSPLLHSKGMRAKSREFIFVMIFFFEVGNTCACVIEGSLLFYFAFPISF